MPVHKQTNPNGEVVSFKGPIYGWNKFVQNYYI